MSALLLAAVSTGKDMKLIGIGYLKSFMVF